MFDVDYSSPNTNGIFREGGGSFNDGPISNVRSQKLELTEEPRSHHWKRVKFIFADIFQFSVFNNEFVLLTYCSFVQL